MVGKRRHHRVAVYRGNSEEEDKYDRHEYDGGHNGREQVINRFRAFVLRTVYDIRVFESDLEMFCHLRPPSFSYYSLDITIQITL